MKASRVKILVIGNCQAGPVSNILERTGAFEMLEPVLVHRAQNDDREAHEIVLQAADFILAQNTADTFPVRHLRTSDLRERFAHKTVIWPNIFYSGQQPFARYLTFVNGDRCFGPIEAVHDLRIFWDWWEDRRGASVRPAMSNDAFEKQIARRSLELLRNREAHCDIAISDLINESWRSSRLFYTFNHPRLVLLNELCRRLLDWIGQQGIALARGQAREPLQRFIVPSIWEQPEGPEGTYVGNDYVLGPGGKTQMRSATKLYSEQSLREAYFACYDHVAEHLTPNQIRFTPNMPFDWQPGRS